MDRTTTLLLALTYAALLFGGAAWVQRRRKALGRSRYRLPAYTLALAVYCTSWTYFGAVGTASTSGWTYASIYAGPILLFLLGPRFLERLIRTVQEEHATSLSDFIASRFGKNKSLAALVAFVALVGTIPYIALQLRSVGSSYALLSGSAGTSLPICVAAIALGLFAILFGTRHYEVGRRHEAVLFAVGAESLIKLAALCAVGIYAVILLSEAPPPLRDAAWGKLANNFKLSDLNMDVGIVTLLSMLAIICLPRQFYVGVNQARHPNDIVRARFPFIAYLVITVAAVPPVAAAGMALLPETSSPDFFVLSLPLSSGHYLLADIVFLGGVSAAAAMVVTECIALSTMIANDIVTPLLLRNASPDEHNVGKSLRLVRRVAIALLLVAATLYALILPAGAQLASVGLMAFAALAQTAPALIYAVYRPDGDATAAKAGLAIGISLWAYTLLLPGSGLSPQEFFGMGNALNPHALFGLNGLSPVAHGAVWSMGGNLCAFIGVSLYRQGRHSARPVRSAGSNRKTISTLGDLRRLVERFAGPAETATAFPVQEDGAALITRASAHKAEKMIARVVGASSAHAIIASAVSGAGVGLHDIAQMLDASSQSLHFSQSLLAATLENIEPGVSVVDSDQRLIAWNTRYLDLFGYPTDMIHIGTPLADLIRYNALRGECGPGELEDHITRRLAHIREGKPHIYQRKRPNGRILKSVGGPMPDGGYVMCFTDITAETQAREELENARAELERRVEERTAELSQANQRLAEAATDKTRFLAAASHDLLQPLHAARLFAAALRRDVSGKAVSTLSRIDSAIEAADELLRALLDISKLDAGGIVPEIRHVSLRPMLVELVENFEPLATERRLRLRLGPGDAVVNTDPTLLRSILQNFLSNAVRYTRTGGVLIGIRRRGANVRMEIYDTGPGIAEHKQRLIFREFERLDAAEAEGIGLGLAIVERTAALLGAKIDLRSQPGRGSRFSVSLPICREPTTVLSQSNPVSGPSRKLRSLALLVVDDDPRICEAMALLLESMGHHALVAKTPAEAGDISAPYDAALIDYNLGDAQDGLAVLETLRTRRPGLPAAMVTADRGPSMVREAKRNDVPILAKPLSASDLQAWLETLAQSPPA